MLTSKTQTAGSGHRVRPRRTRERPTPVAAPAPEPAPATVVMSTDGTIFHARCDRPLEYHRTRGGLELDFYCLECMEHVTLPVHALPRIARREERTPAWPGLWLGG